MSELFDKLSKSIQESHERIEITKEWLNLDANEIDQLFSAINNNSAITDLKLTLGIDQEVQNHPKRALLLEKVYTFLKTSSIKNLDLTYNRIGDAGVKDLADALKGNTTLVKLDISLNNIGDEGANHLAEALKSNTTLKVLKVCNGDIGDAGVIALAGALKINENIVKLDISYNYTEANGAWYLAEAIKGNKTLVKLNLTEHYIVDYGEEYISKALDFNKNILSILGVERSVKSKVIQKKLEKNREDVNKIVDKIVEKFPNGIFNSKAAREIHYNTIKEMYGRESAIQSELTKRYEEGNIHNIDTRFLVNEILIDRNLRALMNTGTGLLLELPKDILKHILSSVDSPIEDPKTSIRECVMNQLKNSVSYVGSLKNSKLFVYSAVGICAITSIIVSNFMAESDDKNTHVLRLNGNDQNSMFR